MEETGLFDQITGLKSEVKWLEDQVRTQQQTITTQLRTIESWKSLLKADAHEIAALKARVEQLRRDYVK